MLIKWLAVLMILCLLMGSCLAADDAAWKRAVASLETNIDNPVPEESRVTVKPGDWSAAYQETDWLSILLLSSDSVNIKENFGRADVVMVCAIHLKTGRIRLLSLPEDALAQPGGLAGQVALEYVNCFGGPPLMVKAVNEALRLPLNRYCAVNLHYFVETLDKLGGVTMRLSFDEAEALGLDPGENHLTGEQALAYVKIRRSGDRQMRARQLLEALARQLTEHFSIKDGLTLLNFAIKAIDTNLTYDNLVDILMAMLDGAGRTGLTARGVTDLSEETAAFCREFLYGEGN